MFVSCVYFGHDWRSFRGILCDRSSTLLKEVKAGNLDLNLPFAIHLIFRNTNKIDLKVCLHVHNKCLINLLPSYINRFAKTRSKGRFFLKYSCISVLQWASWGTGQPLFSKSVTALQQNQNPSHVRRVLLVCSFASHNCSLRYPPGGICWLHDFVSQCNKIQFSVIPQPRVCS